MKIILEDHDIFGTKLTLDCNADGVVLVDPDYLKDRKVFGHVLAAFR